MHACLDRRELYSKTGGVYVCKVMEGLIMLRVGLIAEARQGTGAEIRALSRGIQHTDWYNIYIYIERERERYACMYPEAPT